MTSELKQGLMSFTSTVTKTATEECDLTRLQLYFGKAGTYN